MQKRVRGYAGSTASSDSSKLGIVHQVTRQLRCPSGAVALLLRWRERVLCACVLAFVSLCGCVDQALRQGMLSDDRVVVLLKRALLFICATLVVGLIALTVYKASVVDAKISSGHYLVSEGQRAMWHQVRIVQCTLINRASRAGLSRRRRRGL